MNLNPLYVIVAPYAGAWIETVCITDFVETPIRSPLTRGRGLKHVKFLEDRVIFVVAPYAGAWIETNVKTSLVSMS